jgi:hypothetical protein
MRMFNSNIFNHKLMVFTRLGLGFIVGCAVPFFVNEMVYMTIANSFLRPHLRYQIERAKLKKEQAVSTYLLDSYVKDVVGSFFLFFVAIGPVVYSTVIKKRQAENNIPKRDEIGQVEDDKYTAMLKKIKDNSQEEKKEVET